jgi:4-hydroxy-tetrahydrodipicolinate reductase
MVKVTVAGAAGRMGKRISALCIEHPDIELAGVFERKGHELIGVDFGTIVGKGEINLKLSDSLEEIISDTDVVIDFTTVESTKENLAVTSGMGKAMVIGTTGFEKDDLAEIKAHTKNIPCVLAPNMSVGVNLLFRVLRDVATVLGEDFDIEIIEAHHRLKKDAPSGTALKFAQVIAESLGRDLEKVGVYSRKGIIGERDKKEIGIQTIRAGDIVGEHTVLFGGMGERIELTHRASSRDTFARGALRAALWIHDKNPGLYDMMDVLGLK